jgi:hypothetical protein
VAGLLVACAAIVRRWVHYELTRDQLTVRNGNTGHEIQSIPVENARRINVQQGIVAGFLESAPWSFTCTPQMSF